MSLKRKVVSEHKLQLPKNNSVILPKINKKASTLQTISNTPIPMKGKKNQLLLREIRPYD